VTVAELFKALSDERPGSGNRVARRDGAPMSHDVRLDEIDCIFCWRTCTGEVREGARDMTFNGRPACYRPDGHAPEEGLRTVVDGRATTGSRPPAGFRLSEQGAISRMACHVAGFVTSPSLVPARNARELEELRAAASAAIRADVASEWALAAIHAGPRRIVAVHIAARADVVTDLADLVAAPWTIDIREKVVDHSYAGVRIACFDRRERRTMILEGDSRFGRSPLPRNATQ
jgi:hypothetical protein